MPRRAGVLFVLIFVGVFVIGTYAVSQLTTLAPRLLQGTVYPSDPLFAIGYLTVTVSSLLVLGRMIYSSERSAGRVKRRVRILE